MFSKAPRPGRVKTRLVPPLTPAEAARLAEAMLRDALERFGRGAFTTVLWYAPAVEAPWFARAFPDLRREPQEGPGLGERLAHAFRAEHERGPRATLVAVGSDQPLLGVSRVEAAHRALEAGADVVLGPDRGGGYDLVGLGRPLPELFTTIPMSTESMYAASAALVRARGLRLVELEPGDDVDEAQDLERVRRALARWEAAGGRAHPDFPRRTRSVLASLPLA